MTESDISIHAAITDVLDCFPIFTAEVLKRQSVIQIWFADHPCLDLG